MPKRERSRTATATDGVRLAPDGIAANAHRSPVQAGVLPSNGTPSNGASSHGASANGASAHGNRTDGSGARVGDGATVADRSYVDVASSELRYRRAFESATDGILLLDAATGRIIDANPRLEAIVGSPRADLIGRTLGEVDAVRDVPATLEALEHVQGAASARFEDLTLASPARAGVHVEFVSSSHVAGGMRVVQCNLRDVTSRRLADERLARDHDGLVARVAQMHRRAGELGRLSLMNDLLHACATEKEAYDVAALAAADLFPGHGGFIAPLQRERELEIAAAWGTPVSGADAFPVGACWAIRRGRTHHVIDARTGPVRSHLADAQVSSSLCVPLTVQGETLGVLSLFAGPGVSPAAPSDVRVAVAMAGTIQLSLSNLRLREKLREQATLDALTGLYNRRHLDETLAREIHRARRRKSPLCVAMLDLDHFKTWNDAHGHTAGDFLLRAVGQVLRDHVRRSDVSCRYGGEEFVLVLPDSSLADTRHRVDQIRGVVAALELRHAGRALGRVTLSAGIAMAADDTTPVDLLTAADEALYAAKRAGRDRVAESPAPAEEAP